MDAGKVQILLECLEVGSMMKAAEKLGYTPSGLTHMMDALEKELGLQILERGRYGIRLTHAGEAILPILREFTETEQKLMSTARRLNLAESETIRVGALASMAKNWLPGIVRSFQEKNPQSKAEIVMVKRSKGYEALRSGQIDLLFSCHDESYGYNFMPLKKDFYKAVLPKGTYTGHDGRFDIKDFENYPFIIPTYGRDVDVEQALRKYNVKTNPLAAYADNPVIISMVAVGMGVSMMSEMVLRGSEGNVDVLELDPPVHRVLGLVYKSVDGLSPVEKRFINHVKSVKPK